MLTPLAVHLLTSLLAFSPSVSSCGHDDEQRLPCDSLHFAGIKTEVTPTEQCW